jgi:hypothetical protein
MHTGRHRVPRGTPRARRPEPGPVPFPDLLEPKNTSPFKVYSAVAGLLIVGAITRELVLAPATSAVAAEDGNTAYAAESRIVSDITANQQVQVLSGRVAIGTVCVLNPVIYGDYLLQVGRADPDDAESTIVFATHAARQHTAETVESTIVWDAELGSFIMDGTPPLEPRTPVGATVSLDLLDNC